MNSNLNGNANVSEYFDDEKPVVSLMEILTWLGEEKRQIVGFSAVVGTLALVISLFLPNSYTARTSFLPPVSSQQGGSAAALAALGAIGGMAGSGIKTPDEMYVAVLSSDSVLRGLDERFNLRERYGAKSHDALRSRLGSVVRVSADKKSSMIFVDVVDRDPEFAARLANAHADEISKVLGRMAIGEAQQRRVFYAKQINDAKEALIVAEAALRGVQEKSGVVALEKQAESVVMGVVQLRAAIADREIQMKVLRVDSTAQNPTVLKLTSELNALRQQLVRAESAQEQSGVSVAKLPTAALEFVRAKRELKIQEVLLEGLIRQYEMAKLDEAREGPALQQVDVAYTPDRKSSPKVLLITLGFAMLAMMAAMIRVFVQKYWSKVSQLNPETASAWSGLKHAWRWTTH